MGNVSAAVAEGARRATGATTARAATERPFLSRFYLASPSAQEVFRPPQAPPGRTRLPGSVGPGPCAAGDGCSTRSTAPVPAGPGRWVGRIPRSARGRPCRGRPARPEEGGSRSCRRAPRRAGVGEAHDGRGDGTENIEQESKNGGTWERARSTRPAMASTAVTPHSRVLALLAVARLARPAVVEGLRRYPRLDKPAVPHSAIWSGRT